MIRLVDLHTDRVLAIWANTPNNLPQARAALRLMPGTILVFPKTTW